MQQYVISVIALLTLLSEPVSVQGVFLPSRAGRILQQRSVEGLESDINRIPDHNDKLKFEGCKTQTNHVAFDEVAAHVEEKQTEDISSLKALICPPSYYKIPNHYCTTWAYPGTLSRLSDHGGAASANDYGSPQECMDKCTETPRCDGISYTSANKCYMCMTVGSHDNSASLWKPDTTQSGYARQAPQVVLERDGLNAVTTSCCLASSRHCAGCVELKSDKTCKTCLGGYELQDDGTCLMCANIANWLNDDKQSCVDATCSNTRTRGVSSNMACCSCGGGHSKATTFLYPVANLIVGGGMPPVWAPIPRTARTFSLNKECKFGEYGMQVNGETGALMLRDGCSRVGCGRTEAFQVSCTLTAHQTPKLNATAFIAIIASHFQYASTPLVLFKGEMATPLVVLTGAAMRCIPSGSARWLSLGADGTLTASQNDADYAGAGMGGISGGPMGHLGASCYVTGQRPDVPSKGTPYVNYVIVFAPQPWTSIVYDGASPDVFGSLGEEVLPKKIVPPTDDLVTPHRFSMYCEHQTNNTWNVPFVFDTVTGVATLNGHGALTMDPLTGLIQVAPRKSMSEVFDSMPASNNNIRKKIDLVCRVYGYYDFQSCYHASRVASSATFNVQIRDHICWVERTAKFIEKVNVHVPENQCRQKCRDTMACSDYLYSTSESACYFYRGVCDAGDRCGPSATVFSKILDCGEQSACINLEYTTQRWISGDYCPSGVNVDGPVYQKEGNTIPDTIYLAKWNLDRDGAGAGCLAGKFVLKQAAPGQDFIRPKMNSIELKGMVVNVDNSYCIGHGVELENVWKVGRSDGTNVVKARISGLPCGPPNTTVAAIDPTDDSAEEDDEKEEVQVETLVFDDPATSKQDDHWIHPCDCFPEVWEAKPPVDAMSYEETPANSGNLYMPAPILLIEGEFTCQRDQLLSVGLLDIIEAQEPMTCDEWCQSTSNCQHFFIGEVTGGMQCRLYSTCHRLVREPGMSGALNAKPIRKYCHVANPDLCWATTGRRALLSAHAPKVSQHAECAFMSTVQQCDSKLLLGGMGVTTCSRCQFKEVSDATSFSFKQRLFDTFAHGEQLSLSCWSERFRPMPVVGTGAKASELLTCVSGNWRDSTGELGLSNFACGVCIQVVKPTYIQFAARNKQEVYFINKLQYHLYVSDIGLKTSGKLISGHTHQGSGDKFQLKEGAGGEITLITNNAEYCLQALAAKKNTGLRNEVSLTIFEKKSCNHLEVKQLLSMGTIPAILSDIVFYEQSLLWQVTKSTPDSYAFGFKDLVFDINCNKYAVGELVWLAGATPKTFHLGGACRPAERVGNPFSHLPVALKTKASEKPLDFACPEDASEYFSSYGEDYKGCARTTKSGRTCQNWNDQSPHTHTYANTGLGNHNFCRNPRTPWESTTIGCYTRDPTKGWEECLPLPVTASAHTSLTDVVKSCRNGNPSKIKSALLTESSAMHKALTRNALKRKGDPPAVFIEGRSAGAHYMCVDPYSRLTLNSLQAIESSGFFGGMSVVLARAVLNSCATYTGPNGGDTAGHWYPDYSADCSQKAPSLELKIARQLSGLKLECAAGEAFNRVVKIAETAAGAASNFVLSCATISGMGACAMQFTTQSDIKDLKSGGTNFLESVGVTCGKAEVLQAMIAEKSGDNWFRYQYTCCMVVSLPISIAVVGYKGASFSQYEGVYCPTRRDVSGRLEFSALHNFGGDLHDISTYDGFRRRRTDNNYKPAANGHRHVHPASVTYNRGQAKWCLTGVACVPSITAHPFETKFPETSSWVAVALSDFDAVFEGKGPTQMGAKKREKPTLLTFGATKPEYKEECATQVDPGSDTFSDTAMNKVGMTLDPDNPCSLVIAKTYADGTADTSSPAKPTKTGDPAIGITYESAAACYFGELSRDDTMVTMGLIDNKLERTITGIETYAGLICMSLPDPEVAPLGFGVEAKWVSAGCGTKVKIAAKVAQTVRETTFRILWEVLNDNDKKLCENAVSDYMRTFCDLHCLKDAVKAGDKAVLTALEEATTIADKNADMLMEYYTAGLSDTIKEIRKVHKDTHKQLKKKQAKLEKERLKSMFVEMRGMLGRKLHPAGRATSIRSLNQFASTFASIDQPSVTNSSQLMDDLASEANTLLDTVRIAASDPLSIVGAAALQTASSLQTMDAAFRNENKKFGIYRDSVHKNRQKLALVSGMTVKAMDDAVHMVQTNELVLFIDRSWWVIRAKLDAYLDAADDQTTAFGDAVAVLNGYTLKCTADRNDLNRAQLRAKHADAMASRQLQDTWHSIEHEFGLLVARIVDSHAFFQLAQLDILASDSQVSHSMICSGGEAGHSAALSVVNKAIKTGLAYQTSNQLHGVVMELDMLKNRFAVSGLSMPSDETLKQTVMRAVTSFEEAMTRRSDLAVAMLDRLCPQRPLLHLDSSGEDSTNPDSNGQVFWLNTFANAAIASYEVSRVFLALLGIAILGSICSYLYHLRGA